MAYLRRLPKFEYLPAQNIAEVCTLLADHGERAELLAGGTDLLLQMRRRETSPAYVIGLKGVAELSGVQASEDGGLTIGAMTTMHALLSSSAIRERYGVLAQAAAGIGGPELRNVATIGGNIAGALPCADMPPALITLGAKVKLKSRRGERIVPVDELYPEFGRTVAQEDELLTAVLLPSVPAVSGGAYLKFHDRQSMDMTTIGVSAFVTPDADGRAFRDVKIALASSAPVPMRARRAESVLRGLPYTAKALEKAASIVCDEADPRSSWRASRDFRLELLHGLTKRAIGRAWDNAAHTAKDMS